MRATVSPGRTHARSRWRGELEQPVAGRVPEGVVHGLETVEVEQEHAHIGVVVTRLVERVLQAILEERAIRKPGERIVKRAVLERSFESASFGHVLRQHEGGVVPFEGDRVARTSTSSRSPLLVRCCATCGQSRAVRRAVLDDDVELRAILRESGARRSKGRSNSSRS